MRCPTLNDVVSIYVRQTPFGAVLPSLRFVPDSSSNSSLNELTKQQVELKAQFETDSASGLKVVEWRVGNRKGVKVEGEK